MDIKIKINKNVGTTWKPPPAVKIKIADFDKNYLYGEIQNCHPE